MSDAFVAEIRIFPFSFAPTGWALCQGQLLPISQNTALFSLVGTFYGGDGKSTFALPNLSGQCAVGQGQSSTGTEYFLGEQSGVEAVTLIQSEIPAHNHTMVALADPGTTASAAGAQFATVTSGGSKTSSYNGQIYGTTPANAHTLMTPLAATGGSLPHNNMMPYLTLNFCIAMQGIFPPRSGVTPPTPVDPAKRVKKTKTKTRKGA